MKNILKNIKYIGFGFAVVVTLFSYSKVSANTYLYQCQFSSGNVTTDVTLTPSGPFTTTPTNFDAQGTIYTNNCVTNNVSLSVNNNSGPDQVLIPATTTIPPTGQFPAGLPAYYTFQSPSPTGTYLAEFSTGVDEDDEEPMPICIPGSTFTFVNMGARWGKIYSAPGAPLPRNITVNLYGDALNSIPPNQLSGTVTFNIPNQPNRHSYHNGLDCDAYGCEIIGPYGYDHGVIQNPICGGGGGGYGGGFAHCFVADTKVLMADGTEKYIQDVKLGDVLKGETGNNKVIGFHQPKLGEEKLYSFNGGRYFVTAEHPFNTTDGWKSLNPAKTAEEHLNITVTELKIGDTLITEKGKVKLKSIDSKSEKSDTQLYNFKLDGDHTYYADGYLVHNKVGCSADGSGAPTYPQCTNNIHCLDNTPPPAGHLAIPPSSSSYGTCALPCTNPNPDPQGWCSSHPGGTFCSTDAYIHNCP